MGGGSWEAQLSWGVGTPDEYAGVPPSSLPSAITCCFLHTTLGFYFQFGNGESELVMQLSLAA